MGWLKILIPFLTLAIVGLKPQTILAAAGGPVVIPDPSVWTGDCVAGPDNDVVTIRGITCLITNVIKPLPALIVLVALGMILFASVKVILSGSDPKAYATGMQTMLYAIIGIILLSAAWLILVLIERFTGAPITTFGVL
jgi:hypothetical protein